MRTRGWIEAIGWGLLFAVASAQSSRAERREFPRNEFDQNIPDGLSGCPNFGPALEVDFMVSGMVAPLGSVQVEFRLAPVHTWAGDLEVVLFAPNGASQLLFAHTGAVAPDALGDSSDVEGLYTFVDFFDTGAGNWWTAAAAASAAVALPAGRYRTSTAGGAAGSGAQTLTNPVFSGLSTAQINGTWKLRFRDRCLSDTGRVAYAMLALMNPTVLDLDGDGATDYVVIRNTGGGPSGATTWIANVPPSANLIFRDGFDLSGTTPWSTTSP